LKQPEAQRLSQIMLPGGFKFIPELVLVASGLDAAKGEPLGLCLVIPMGYGQPFFKIL